LWWNDEHAALRLVRARYERPTTPMQKMPANGSDFRACVLELRLEVQKRFGLENPRDYLALCAGYRPQYLD